MLVLGKINKGELEVLNIACRKCGAMFSLKDFKTDLVLCPVCLKNFKEVSK